MFCNTGDICECGMFWRLCLQEEEEDDEGCLAKYLGLVAFSAISHGITWLPHPTDNWELPGCREETHRDVNNAALPRLCLAA